MNANEMAAWAKCGEEVVYLIRARIFHGYRDSMGDKITRMEPVVFGPYSEESRAISLVQDLAKREDCFGARLIPVNTSDSPFVAPKRN